MFGFVGSSVESREPTGYQLALQSKEEEEEEEEELLAAVEGGAAEEGEEEGERTAVVVRGRGPSRRCCCCGSESGDGDDATTRRPKAIPFPAALFGLDAAAFEIPRTAAAPRHIGEALSIGGRP